MQLAVVLFTTNHRAAQVDGNILQVGEYGTLYMPSGTLTFSYGVCGVQQMTRNLCYSEGTATQCNIKVTPLNVSTDTAHSVLTTLLQLALNSCLVLRACNTCTTLTSTCQSMMTATIGTAATGDRQHRCQVGSYRVQTPAPFLGKSYLN